MKTTPKQIHLTTTIPDSLSGSRLDQALATLFPEYSRSRIQTWIHNAQIKINDQSTRPRHKVRGGEKVVIIAELEATESWGPEPIALDILYEDNDILVVNKAAGIVVHPAIGNRTGTLVNALLYHAPELAQLPRAGIIHRLDKDTSGLLVIAKTLPAHTALVKQLQKRLIKREYEAIVIGTITAGGTIDAPMGRHAKHRKQMAITINGKPAVTHYRVIERFRTHTHLRILLETGRTHQIRVHMAHIHHPLVGDPTYGGRLRLPANINNTLRDTLRHFHRQALHAIRLGLTHPTTHEYQEWTTPIPNDMQQLLNTLRSNQHVD